MSNLESKYSELNFLILLLFGLPAAGKSSFAKELINHNKSNINTKSYLTIFYVCYDEILVYSPSINSSEHLDINNWKQDRTIVVQFIDQLITLFKTDKLNILESISTMQLDGSCSIKLKLVSALKQQIDQTQANQIIFLLDDNFYYESMRYSFYQISKRHNISYGQIYFPIDKIQAIKQNEKRQSKVEENIIVTMSDKFEEPKILSNHWEKHSYILNSLEEHYSWSHIYAFINNCFTNPEHSDVEDKLKLKELSKEVSLKSVLHQADIILRKCVSNKMKNTSHEDKKLFSRQVNNLRDNILDRIRNGNIILINTSFATDEKESLILKFQLEVEQLFDDQFLSL